MSEYKSSVFYGAFAGLLAGVCLGWVCANLALKEAAPVSPSPTAPPQPESRKLTLPPLPAAKAPLVAEVVTVASAAMQRSVASASTDLTLTVTNPVTVAASDPLTPTNRGSLRLAWDASPDPSVIGYALYYGKSSRSYDRRVDVGNVTNAPLTGLDEGVTYYIAAVGYDTNKLDSVLSNEVIATTPFYVSLRRDFFSVEAAGRMGATNQMQTSSNLIDWRTLLEWKGTGRLTNLLQTNLANSFYRVRVK